MMIAVLDANVLFPMVLRDTLLRAAAAGCFRAHWSSRILEEVTRNLVDVYGMDATKAAALRTAMQEAFPEAEIGGWELLETAMRNHPKDRHVSAAAAKVGAHAIVTANTRDFACLPSGIVAMSPDRFLLALLEGNAALLVDALAVQAAGYRRPPLSVDELVRQLASSAPTFSKRAMAIMHAPAPD